MGMSVTIPPDRTRRWTAAEVRGELLVMSSPSMVHQRAVKLLTFALGLPACFAEVHGEVRETSQID